MEIEVRSAMRVFGPVLVVTIRIGGRVFRRWWWLGWKASRIVKDHLRGAV